MDLVPNHTSSRAPVVSGRAGRRARAPTQRERYIFRDGRGPGGVQPPNNWVSIFGGPAWTRVVEPDGNPGQWYLHLFDAEQPDLNWDNPEVFDDLEKTLRFWLDRGVDGFRIDVAHGMAKPPGLPDMEVTDGRGAAADDGRRPAVQPRRRARDPPPHPRGAQRLSATRWRSARCGCSTTSSSPGTCGPTNCTSASTSGWCAPSSTPPTSAGRSRTRWPPRRSRTPRRPGRCPTTTSTARSPATAAATSGWPARGRWRW